MKTISISEAKASLSEQLRHVRRGGQVVITSRGKAVARIVPIGSGDGDLADLESMGLARRASNKLPKSFWTSTRPNDRSGSLRAAVANEREDAW